MASESDRPTLFLSYAHGDQAPAQRLARALERAGYTVWWDALIEGGSRFAASIDEALQQAPGCLCSIHRSNRNTEGECVLLPQRNGG